MNVRVIWMCIGAGSALGCGGSPLQAGLTSTCLYVDGDAAIGEQSDLDLQVTGTVVTDEPFVDTAGWCSVTTRRALTIEGDDGKTYQLGYGIEDEAGEDLTPPLPIGAGQPAELLYRQHTSFGTAAGFVLTSGGALQAALEMGAWGSALRLDDVPGVTVSAGAGLGTEVTDCGLKSYYEVRFDGDGDRRVAPVGEVEITVVGQHYQAFAIARFEWPDNAQCTDLSGVEMWGIWRAP